LMMLENISLTMHNDKLSYEISLKISLKKAAYLALGTSLLESQIKISPYVSRAVFFFFFFDNFCVTAKVTMIHRKI
jgi:hypothetical protein